MYVLWNNYCNLVPKPRNEASWMAFQGGNHIFSCSGHGISSGIALHGYQQSLSLSLPASNGYRINWALKFFKIKNLRIICSLQTVICRLCFWQFLIKSVSQCSIWCAHINKILGNAILEYWLPCISNCKIWKVQ